VDQRLPALHLQVLWKIVSLLKDKDINWVLTGSTGMALQGMPLEVHDIDLQTDEAGAYEIDRLLADYAVKPVRYKPSERIRSHFGEFMMDGVEVEVMGDMVKLLDNSTWEPSVDIAALRCWVEIDGSLVPVLPLEYEYQAYLKMGRFERAEMLRAFIEKKHP
jgi:hypothetical protein